MGRRSQHTQEELRELIIKAARQGVESGKGEMPSARNIARLIGYAPGTLYNVFENLDEIMLRVEAGVLEELDSRLGEAVQGRSGADALKRFTAAYVAFAYDNPELWKLIQQHHPAENDGKIPEWYLERLYGPITRLEPLIAKASGNHDADDVARTARLVWSSVHGVVHVATTMKFGALPLATTIGMAEQLVQAFVAGYAPVAAVERREPPRRAAGMGKSA